MTAFDDKITAGFGYWRNGAQGSSCTAAILSRECLLWVNNGHCAVSGRCPLYPQKRTFDHAIRMSALGQKRTPALQQKLLAIRSPRRQGQVVCLEFESQALWPSYR
jgi:hypothetical protein